MSHVMSRVTECVQAKKRQVYLEETYSGCMKELELLLDNFRLENPKPSKGSAMVAKKSNVYNIVNITHTFTLHSPS